MATSDLIQLFIPSAGWFLVQERISKEIHVNKRRPEGRDKVYVEEGNGSILVVCFRTTRKNEWRLEYPVSQPVGSLFSALFQLNWIVGFVELQTLVESAKDLTPLLSRIFWDVYE